MQVNDIVENFTLQNQDGKPSPSPTQRASQSSFSSTPAPIPQAGTIESCGFREPSRSSRKRASSSSVSHAIR